MRRHRRATGLLSIAAAGLIFFAVGCGGDDDMEMEQINLVATDGGVSEIDTGRKGPSEGDMNVFDTPLVFADDRESAGRLIGTQTTISLDDQKEIVQGLFTIELEEGTIVVGGVSEYPRGNNALTEDQEFERAVIGGTGKYSDVMGTDTTVLNADGEYEHELRLEN